MRCPSCGASNDRVLDSRETPAGDSIRRRRECMSCGARFTTFETVEQKMPRVVKRDGRREAFDRKKIEQGLNSACQKRAIPSEDIHKLIDDVVFELSRRLESEVSSETIGTLIMDRLINLDKVAYVRFASVYWAFNDPHQFVAAVKNLADKLHH